MDSRFVFRTDRAGRYWIWDSKGKCNVAMQSATREDAFLEALALLSNSYYRVLAERNAAQAIVDKIQEIVCPDED